MIMQNRNRPIDTENVLVVARWEGFGGEKGEVIKKYELVVKESPWGYTIQHRVYSKKYNYFV